MGDLTPPPVRRLERTHRPTLAWRQRPGAGPTILFLPGYASDMDGGKAQHLDALAARTGHGCVRFDYAGCGLSDGRFEDQTLTDWLDDALAVVGQVAGPLVLVGSSMGGWLMLTLAARLLSKDPGRVVGLVGIAAAPDFTAWDYDANDIAVMASTGRLERTNPYGPEPMLTTHALWASGAELACLDAMPVLDGEAGPLPVRLLHGLADQDVPVAIAHRLMAALHSDDVQLTLVKDGDHRLSRPGDLALLARTVAAFWTD